MPKKRQVFTYLYDKNNFDPPAPVLEVSLTVPAPTSTQSVKLPALLDSGADMATIPQWIVQQLQLKYVDEISVSGYKGIPERALVYSVKIIFDDLGEFVIKAITSENNHILVGRDILNKWSLLLEGRRKIFEIT